MGKIGAKAGWQSPSLQSRTRRRAGPTMLENALTSFVYEHRAAA